MTRFSDRSDVEREPNALAAALGKAEVTHDLTPTNPVAVGDVEAEMGDGRVAIGWDHRSNAGLGRAFADTLK